MWMARLLFEARYPWFCGQRKTEACSGDRSHFGGAMTNKQTPVFPRPAIGKNSEAGDLSMDALAKEHIMHPKENTAWGKAMG